MSSKVFQFDVQCWATFKITAGSEEEARRLADGLSEAKGPVRFNTNDGGEIVMNAISAEGCDIELVSVDGE